jgi:hypothetical protein
VTLGNDPTFLAIAVDCYTSRGHNNPQTVSGDVAVGGVGPSTSATTVEQTFAHTALASSRRLSGLDVGVLADAAPRSQAGD